MPTHTFYLTDTTATSPGWYGILQDGGTPPTAANTTGQIAVAKLAVGSFITSQSAGATAGSGGTSGTTSIIDARTGPLAGTGSPASSLGDCWRTSATLTGVFASGNWTIAVGFRMTTGVAQGRARVRIWRSANVDGSSPTDVAGATQVGTTTAAMSSTTTTFTSTITWAAPSFTVTSEYLFFQVEFQEQTSAGTSSTGKYALRTGSETTIATTDLGTGAPFIFPRTKPYRRR